MSGGARVGRAPKCNPGDPRACSPCRDEKRRKREKCKKLHSTTELQLLSASGFGGRVRAGDESWLHPGPAEAKRPRFAPGFYEPLHGFNAALYDALESAAAEQQAVILAGWDKFACSELLNFFDGLFDGRGKS